MAISRQYLHRVQVAPEILTLPKTTLVHAKEQMLLITSHFMVFSSSKM